MPVSQYIGDSLRVLYLFAQNRQIIFFYIIFESPCVEHSYDVLVLLLHTYIQYALVLQALGSQFCQAAAAAAAAQRLIRSPFNPGQTQVRLCSYPSRVPLPTAAIAMSSTESRVIAIAVIVVVTLVCAARYGSAAATAARSH